MKLLNLFEVPRRAGIAKGIAVSIVAISQLILVAAIRRASTCPEATDASLRRAIEFAGIKKGIANPKDIQLRNIETLPGSCVQRVTLSPASGGGSFAVYLSPDRRYLFPSALDLDGSLPNPPKMMTARAPSSPGPAAEKLNAQQVQELSAGAPTIGPTGAPVTIVEFGDFQCPFCKELHETLKREILPAHPKDVRLVYRFFPLEAHAWALPAAEAGDCVSRQEPESFWAIGDMFYEGQAKINQSNLTTTVTTFANRSPGLDGLQNCISSKETSRRIREDIALGTKYGVHSTPTLFINGSMQEGTRSAAELEAEIKSELGKFDRNARSGHADKPN